MGLFPSSLTPESINERWLPPLDRSLGLRIDAISERGLVASFTVGEAHLQPHGIMHGGISCVVGESLGSLAGGLLVGAEGKTVVGQSLYALHLRPAKSGMRLEARAEPKHLGRRTQIWEIHIKDNAQNKPISQITLTVAVIDQFEKSAQN